MKYLVKTYGCQMNERDSDAARAMLDLHGFSRVEVESDADIIIINTCSIRGKAEGKAVGKMRWLASARWKRDGRLLGAFGCMVQRMGADVFKEVRGLDFAVGTHKLALLPSVIQRSLAGEPCVIEAGARPEVMDDFAAHAEHGISAFVNILLGCDRRCSYCIVPTVRGREWSRPVDKIIDEVKALAAKGVKEVTLLGQSVMQYGKKNKVLSDGHQSPGGYQEVFSALLEAVAGIEGIRRIRFASGHPSGCTEELARAMSELGPVCGHLHLPVQSGSDRILKLMRRGYVADDYRKAVAVLRSYVPDIAITTDIIAGYPSETVEDFEQTRRLMDEIGFDNSFIFKYSPRSGTPAAEMEDDVPEDEKMRRNKVLLEDQDRIGLAINERQVGKEEEILVEGVSLRNKSRYSGRTRSNKITFFDPEPGMQPGSIVNVKITSAKAQTLYGEVIQK